MRVLIFWSAIVMSLLIGAAHSGPVPFHIFFLPAQALMIYGPILAYGFYHFGARGLFNFSKRIFGGNVTDEDSVFINVCATLGLLMSGIASGVSFALTMGSLDLGSAVIGHNIATTMVCAVYGCLPAAFLLPIRPATNNVTQTSSNNLKKAAGFMVFSFFVVGSLFTTIMWMLSSPS